MQLVVVVAVVEEEKFFFVGQFEANLRCSMPNRKGCAWSKGGGSYAQIVSVGNQFCGFRFGHGGGGIFVDAGWGIYSVTSVTGGG